MSSNVIAIDGPAASGKSTVARRLSEALGIAYINTGALYRAVAWKLYRCGLDPYSVTPGQVDQVLAETTISYERITPDAPLEIKIDGVFPGTELRRAEISAAASKVATMPNVRAWLLDLQRGMAKLGRIVMEGRDIGTAVFPDAQFKFFLTASPLVRARRPSFPKRRDRGWRDAGIRGAGHCRTRRTGQQPCRCASAPGGGCGVCR